MAFDRELERKSKEIGRKWGVKVEEFEVEYSI
jgi:hypothetical protein